MKKSIIILAFCAFVYVAAQEDQSTDGDDGEERKNGVNGWFVPTVDGFTQWIGLKEAQELIEKIRVSEATEMALAPVTFHLYTKSNPTFGKEITPDVKSLNNSNFNPQNPTRFVIHGLNQFYFSEMNKEITEAWLKLGDFNIIIVDWARARSVEYVSSVVAVPTVGKKVATMMDFLATTFSIPLEDFHVIGHSLGAHVAGFTGKSVETGKLGTIVALDAALPLYSYDEPSERLNRTDADYVQIIHTNAGNLGFVQPIGDSDFYVNGGEKQPSCNLDALVFGACSHRRSYDYYAEAVADNSFSVIECNDYESAINARCGSNIYSLRMGLEAIEAKLHGIFYVPVNDKKPYGTAQN